MYFIGDGIFDNLSNDEIFNKIWSYKKLGEVHNDIRALCGMITDGIIKYSIIILVIALLGGIVITGLIGILKQFS